MVWSWDRSEDLSFLPADAGVAHVVLAVELVGGEIRLRPRHGSMVLPARIFVLPVVHVDALPRWRPALDLAQENRLVQIIAQAAQAGGVGAVQVDFEALPSQRAFYRRVLHRVRVESPDTYLSITALASWCLGERWIQRLPVDEVVAMAFRMGADAEAYRRRISGSAAWPVPRCTSSGIATDEPAVTPAEHQRLYLFSPQPWTFQRWRQTLADHTR